MRLTRTEAVRQKERHKPSNLFVRQIFNGNVRYKTNLDLSYSNFKDFRNNFSQIKSKEGLMNKIEVMDWSCEIEILSTYVAKLDS